MPVVKVIANRVRPSVKKVPTSTTLTMMPMTLDRIKEGLASEDERPTRIDNLDDAFAKFKPSIEFETEVQDTQFRMDLDFKSLKDFDPKNLQTKQEVKGEDGSVRYKRNDLADLKSKIDVLYQVKTLWARPAVQRAWGNEARRKEILDALSALRHEIERLPGGQS